MARQSQRSVSATKTAGVFFKTTKTGGVRLVSLTTQAVAALHHHHGRAEQTALAAGRQVEPADQVFTSDPSGRRPWRPELVTRRWERLRDRGGLPHVRIHDLGHLVATELLTAGIDARTVANRLGHARTSTTLDIYGGGVGLLNRARETGGQRIGRPVPIRPGSPSRRIIS